MATETDIEARIAAIRRFNRSYTKTIGVLHEGLLQSPFSLTEARVLFELAQGEAPTATALVEELGLDAGYLSRILREFEARGLLSRKPSAEDRRRSLLALTKKGREAFARLDTRSRDEVRSRIAQLAVADQDRLIGAMGAIETLLAGHPESAIPYLLRPHRHGDLGWIVYRHGTLYAQEYGWDERFEALVAEIVAEFVRHFDPKVERCWIAERDGQNVGSVLLVKKSKTVAKLRLLLVEPSARGLGIGSRLVGECTTFARQVGYKKIVLWTNNVLHSARRIYTAAGYRLVREEPHQSWGEELVGETWELRL
jgi:DNA-binding MarR family transcriptional regulator/N-acetylglutamate synthase-like GNAT family acetyltransferase